MAPISKDYLTGQSEVDEKISPHKAYGCQIRILKQCDLSKNIDTRLPV